MPTTPLSPAFIFGALVLIHGIFFVIISRAARLSIESSVISFFGGVGVWYLMFLLAYGGSGSIDIQLPLAAIEISGRDFLGKAYEYMQNSLQRTQYGGDKSTLAYVFTPAIFEEVGKFLFLVFTFLILCKIRVPKKIENVGTAAGAISLVALGFATAENIQYVVEVQKDIEINLQTLKSIVSRSVLLPLVHMSFSLYSGFGFGKAIYLRWEMLDGHKIGLLRKWFKKGSRSAGDRYVMQVFFILLGLVSACTMHITYNYLIKQQLMILALVFSLANIFVFLWLFRRLKKTQHYQTLSERIRIEQQIKKLKQKRETRLS